MKLRLARVRRLTAGEIDHEHPAWSPDGRRLAFSAGPVDASRVYVVDRKGRLASAIAAAGPRASRPRWTPDGRKIAFDARVLDEPPCILVQDLPEGGHDPRRLVAGREGAAAMHAAYSPDGRHVAFASDEGARDHFRLWLLDLETGERRKLTDDAGVNDAHPAFSPDGALLAFHRYLGEQATQSSIHVLNMATGQMLRLTDAPGFDKHACFATPHVVVFHREHTDGAQELRTVHLVEGHDAPIRWDGADGKRDAKQPAVRLTRRGRIRVAFAGRPRETQAGSPRPYDVHVGVLVGLDARDT